MNKEELVELVRQAQAGDRDAFDRLLKPLYEPLLRYARSRLRRIEDACDLAHDVVARVLTKLDQLENPASFPSWVFSIARHAIFDWLKDPANAQVSLLAELQADLMPADDYSAMVFDLWEEVNALPADLGEVIRLRYAMRCSHGEMAEVLGVAKSTVNKWLGEARKWLQQRWRGGDSQGDFQIPWPKAPFPSANGSPGGP
jgi:RNA polymerase sigma-70 factor (ECF subfamily)